MVFESCCMLHDTSDELCTVAVTLDHPSIAALAEFIATLIAPQQQSQALAASSGGRLIGAVEAEGPQLIDIVGVSCMYPGEQINQELWEGTRKFDKLVWYVLPEGYFKISLASKL